MPNASATSASLRDRRRLRVGPRSGGTSAGHKPSARSGLRRDVSNSLASPDAFRRALNAEFPMPAVTWERVTKSKWLTPKVLAIISILSLLVFVFSASRALAATTYHVKVGGEIMGLPLAKGGMVWYNGYDPSSIVIHPGDTIVWDGVGGVHTVTSADVLSKGSFVCDSS